MKNKIILLTIIMCRGMEASWNSYSLKFLGGVHAEVIEMNYVDSSGQQRHSDKGWGALGGWAVEKGWLFGKNKNKYFGIEFSFPYSEDTVNALKGEIKAHTSIINFLKYWRLPVRYPGYVLLLFPIWGANFGYITDNDSLITLSFPYLWSIAGSYRKFIKSRWSIEFRGIYFLDRVTVKDGIHDLHFTFSINRHL